MDNNWQKTFALMKDKDPVASRLLTWIYATETNLPVAVRDLMRFVDENPGWPRLGDFRDKIEEGIGDAHLRPHEVASWFRRNPPRTYEGMKAYMQALLSFNETDSAKRAMAEFWREAELDKNETASLAAAWRAYLSPRDHAARLDALLWAGRYGEAEYMLAFVTPAARAAGQARLALARRAKNAIHLLDAVPPSARGDHGLVFERVRWYRRKNDDAKALELMNSLPAPSHPEIWWEERNILARRAIERLDFSKAHAIIAQHSLKDGPDFAQAEWMLGWLELRFLNNPAAAYPRFEAMYARVQSAISKSRAAYWAARAAEKLGRAQDAGAWDEKAAGFLSTYYGQLSLRKLGRTAPAHAAAPPAPAAKKAFEGRELVHAVRILRRVGLDQCVDAFLARLVADAKTREDYQLAAILAKDAGRNYYAVQANKDIQQKRGDYLASEGYPLLSAPAPAKPEKALVHAIIYRESMFNAQAVSTAGALGLMQLMPATAKAMSGQKKRFRKETLTTDPRFNVRLGAAYLAALIDGYDGYVPLAIAAYNTGPGNVQDWADTFGSPRKGARDIVDWVELIPNHETRNYVQRVMESWYMYRLKLGLKPVTVLDF